MESIDALAKAVNEFEGGLVLVSHDMRLIGQVAKEIWICDDKTITTYRGDILNFKMEMRAQMGIGSETAPLRGDASTKVKPGDQAVVQPKKEKPTESKLEVVAPKPKAAVVVDLEAVAPPTTTPPPPTLPQPTRTEPPALVVEEPTAPAPTAPAAANKDNNEPPKNRYVPPHLRRKMQQQQGSM